MHADRIEREISDEARALDEDSSTPELGSHDEAPFGNVENGIERAHLEQPDGVRHPTGHDAKAHVLALAPLTDRPFDESLESLHRRRWRRNETRHFLSGDHREQRR